MGYKDFTFACLGIEKIDKEKFQNPQSGGAACGLKPIGGLWFSKYEQGQPTSWQDWCCLEDFKDIYNKGITFKLKEDTNFFIIDSDEDIDTLFRLYTKHDKKSEEFNRICGGVTIDYERLQKDYDGLYVSEEGIRYAYMRMYGWDVESGVLFNLDSIKEWNPIREEEFMKVYDILVDRYSEKDLCWEPDDEFEY